MQPKHISLCHEGDSDEAQDKFRIKKIQKLQFDHNAHDTRLLYLFIWDELSLIQFSSLRYRQCYNKHSNNLYGCL